MGSEHISRTIGIGSGNLTYDVAYRIGIDHTERGDLLPYDSSDFMFVTTGSHSLHKLFDQRD